MSRFLLPSPFAALRPNFGAKLRSARESNNLALKVLAGRVGITRETLSRIENGQRMPRPRVMDALLLELGLDWKDIATKGPPPYRPYVRGSRGHQLMLIGESIQDRRQNEGKTLRELAIELGISLPTLSRLERGQLCHSRLFRDPQEAGDLDLEDTLVDIVHRKLAAYVNDC